MPLVPVIGADDATYEIAYVGQDTINDASGSLPAGAVGVGATLQQILIANVGRVGYLFQNTSRFPMLLNDLNDLAASAWIVGPGECWPRTPGYPITTAALQVVGTENSQLGDTYSLREWING